MIRPATSTRVDRSLDPRGTLHLSPVSSDSADCTVHISMRHGAYLASTTTCISFLAPSTVRNSPAIDSQGPYVVGARQMDI